VPVPVVVSLPLGAFSAGAASEEGVVPSFVGDVASGWLPPQANTPASVTAAIVKAAVIVDTSDFMVYSFSNGECCSRKRCKDVLGHVEVFGDDGACAYKQR